MVNSILSTELPTSQLHIDLVAQDLCDAEATSALPAPSLLAELLDLCPEQNVWMYEPDPLDPDSDVVNAIFRLQATRGITFHMSCLLHSNGSILAWTGPYDISIPKSTEPTLLNAIAA